jgi:hypothetical protein
MLKYFLKIRFAVQALRKLDTLDKAFDMVRNTSRIDELVL